MKRLTSRWTKLWTSLSKPIQTGEI